MDYQMPTAAEMPPLRIEHLETPSSVTPLGLKGAGEAGTTGCAAAIANAVADALSDLGVDVVETPITPPRLLALIRAAEAVREAEGVGEAGTFAGSRPAHAAIG
jgi:CO/xanthine dehydrogenase Mo-binding subunit